MEVNGHDGVRGSHSPSRTAVRAAQIKRLTSFVSASEVDYVEENNTAAAAREQHRCQNIAANDTGATFLGSIEPDHKYPDHPPNSAA